MFLNQNIYNIFTKALYLNIILLCLISCSDDNEVEVKYDERLEIDKSFRNLYKFSEFSSYQDYYKGYRKAILEHNHRFDENTVDYILPKDQSKECAKENKTAVLLVHGLTDSPFSLHDVQYHFVDKCYYTRAMMIPGHGLKPGALLNVGYQDWINAIEFNINDLRKNFDNIILLGYSTGGSLVINQAYKSSDDFIKAIILISPAVKIKNQHLHPISYIMKNIGTIFPKLAWFSIGPNEHYFKYQSTPYKSFYETFKVIKESKKLSKNKNIDIPIYLTYSDVDTTVNSKASFKWYNNLSGNNNRLLIFSSSKSDDDLKKGIKYYNSQDIESKILDLSHISLHVRPDNMYYGKHGTYRSCLHYLSDKEKYFECKNIEISKLFAGETTGSNKDSYFFNRISYNPYFRDFWMDLEKWVSTI